MLEDDEQRAKDKRNKSQQGETQNVVEIVRVSKKTTLYINQLLVNQK